MIDTKRVTVRRSLRFEKIDDAIRDADMLAAAEKRGTLRATGNWTLGQALGHIAFWANTPFEGYRGMKRPPWLVRQIVRLMKHRLLNRGLPSGAKIPGVPGGTFGVDLMETADGLSAMRTAFERLAAECPAAPNIMFGPLTHEEWINLNLRHAELHLSFFHAE